MCSSNCMYKNKVGTQASGLALPNLELMNRSHNIKISNIPGTLSHGKESHVDAKDKYI